jgi:hypothetical protein
VVDVYNDEKLFPFVLFLIQDDPRFKINLLYIEKYLYFFPHTLEISSANLPAGSGRKGNLD